MSENEWRIQKINDKSSFVPSSSSLSSIKIVKPWTIGRNNKKKEQEE